MTCDSLHPVDGKLSWSLVLDVNIMEPDCAKKIAIMEIIYACSLDIVVCLESRCTMFFALSFISLASVRTSSFMNDQGTPHLFLMILSNPQYSSSWVKA